MNDRNDASDLLRLLDTHYHNPPQRNRERNVDCPLCGKPAKSGSRHFAYNERGGYCFVCCHGIGLHALCERLRLIEGAQDKYLPAPVYVPQERPRVIADWTHDIPALLKKYTTHPRRYDLWQAHKPLSRRSIETYRLGVGVLPNCSCKHERLIIPIYQGGNLVTFFGRTIACDCTKWLPPGGATVTRWLFGLDALAPSRVVWIVENKADAILLTQQYPDYLALSPSAISVRDEWDTWTEAIKAAKPKRVIVALDNDLAGNGGGTNRSRWLNEWRSEMRQRQPDLWRTIQPPAGAGVRLVNQLLQAGLPATLFQYPATAPHKASVADLFTQEQAA